METFNFCEKAVFTEEEQDILRVFSGFDFSTILSPSEVEVLKEYVLYDKSMHQISLEQGKSYESIMKVYYRMRKKLINYLEKEKVK